MSDRTGCESLRRSCSSSFGSGDFLLQREPVKVPDRVVITPGVHDHLQGVSTRGQADSRHAECLPRLPAVRLWHRNWTAHVPSVYGEMEDAACYICRDPHVQRVRTRILDVDGIVQPAARIGGTHVVPTARIGAILDIDGFSGAVIRSAIVLRIAIPVRKPFPPAVKVFHLN